MTVRQRVDAPAWGRSKNQKKEIRNEKKLLYIGAKPELYKSAIIGITHDRRHIVYSYSYLIEAYVREGMTEDEAHDFCQANTAEMLKYAGPYAPLVIMDGEDVLDEIM